jgi:hypothetical protein
MTWTLLDIEQKVRNITGAPSTDQLSDADLLNYINNYYVFTMPFELKEQIEDNYLDFKTVVGQDVYSFPGGYFTDQPGAYADGFPLIFYQDKDVFYQDWPQQYAVDNLTTGDGITVNFTGGLQNPPLIMGTLFITDGTQVLQDDGAGTFTGDGFGTINYVTGAYDVTFTAAPSSSSTIYAKYQGYSGNRPQGMLFFQNQFTLRPVPDQVYQIRLEGYIKPIGLALATDVAMQEEWGALIAYGAALEIFSDRGDLENYERYYSLFKRQENVSLGRTIQQLNSQQSVPRF